MSEIPLLTPYEMGDFSLSHRLDPFLPFLWGQEAQHQCLLHLSHSFFFHWLNVLCVVFPAAPVEEDPLSGPNRETIFPLVGKDPINTSHLPLKKHKKNFPPCGTPQLVQTGILFPPHMFANMSKQLWPKRPDMTAWSTDSLTCGPINGGTSTLLSTDRPVVGNNRLGWVCFID